MLKATAIGHFGTEECSDGQTIKTKIVTKVLEDHLGPESVGQMDTHGSVKTLLKAPTMVCSAFCNSENVIVLPAQNGLKIIAPLCAMQKRKHPNVGLHYVVIGGWLPALLKRYRYLQAPLRRFDGIYVETSTMKRALEEMGFTNVEVLPNCKDLKILREDELVYSTTEPLKLCTFSRVMKEKGIEDATRAVSAVNEAFGRTVYALDIYGSVERGQEQWFDELKAKFPPFICYRGVAPYDKSAEILQSYFALLFPTHFYTEGIPGTILDAYAAGVPVIASKWESFADLIENGKTGIGYVFDDANGLLEILKRLADNPEEANAMKKCCLEHARRYVPQEAVAVLIQRMDASR